jgi:hypothetical protein
MQTSSKVTSLKKSGLLAKIINSLFGAKKEVETVPHEPVGGKGRFFECKRAIEHAYDCRRSQSQRRKLARRVG